MFIVTWNFDQKKRPFSIIAWPPLFVTHANFDHRPSHLFRSSPYSYNCLFPIVLWWRETSSRTSYVTLSNFSSQAHVKTGNCAAPPFYRRQWKKVLEFSTLSFSRLFVSFTNSFTLSATLFLGNKMSFKDPIWCDYKLGQFSSYFHNEILCSISPWIRRTEEYN